jgi:hypothetical protein
LAVCRRGRAGAVVRGLSLLPAVRRPCAGQAARRSGSDRPGRPRRAALPRSACRSRVSRWCWYLKNQMHPADIQDPAVTSLLVYWRSTCLRWRH